MDTFIDITDVNLLEIFGEALLAGEFSDVMQPVTPIDLVDVTVDRDVFDQVFLSKESGIFYRAVWFEEIGAKECFISFLPVKPVEKTITVYEEI